LNDTHKQEMTSIKDQHDRLSDALKNKNRSVIESREGEIKMLTDENTKLSVLSDKLQKENKNIKNELNKLNSILKESSERKDDKVDEYLKKIHELESKIVRMDQEGADRLRHLTNEKNELENSCRQYQNSFN